MLGRRQRIGQRGPCLRSQTCDSAHTPLGLKHVRSAARLVVKSLSSEPTRSLNPARLVALRVPTRIGSEGPRGDLAQLTHR